MSDIVASYFFHPRKGVTPEGAARAICEEGTSSMRGPIPIQADYARRLDGSVVSVTSHGRGFVARIRYPAELFEPGNIAQYLSVVAGNVSGIADVDAIRLVDVEYPEPLARMFRGPKFGIEGIRKLIGSKNRPHIGTVIRPKAGLTPEDTAAVAYEAAIGGVDLIIDSEIMADQEFCSLENRVPLVMTELDDAKDETGRRVLYAVNVTTRPDQIVERAARAIELGANMIMVNAFATGFGVLQVLSQDPAIRVPIHVHRTMHAALTRYPGHGIAMRPLAQIMRFLGADQLQTGSVTGKSIHDAARVKLSNQVLTCSCHAVKPVFPVSGGGLHPVIVAGEIEALGTDCVLMAGAGIYEHPDGIAAGARAMRQAVDAYVAGTTAEEYAKDHFELERALNHWDNRKGA
jgi:ribulose-bisphosphate carboxylase large chain